MQKLGKVIRMASINTNTAAMNALSTLRNINNNLATTQDRIGSGLKISSAKDNAAYFSISESMKGDSNMYAAIDEGLTLTKNSLATARLGATAFKDLANQFVERVSFAQSGKDSVEDIAKELEGIIKQMGTTIKQATFNGDDLVRASGVATVTANAAAVTAEAAAGPPAVAAGALTVTAATEASRNVVTGISRTSSGFEVTTMSIEQVDLAALLQDFTNLAHQFKDRAGNTDPVETVITAAVADDPLTPGVDESAPAVTVQTSTKGADYLKGLLKSAEEVFGRSVDAATSLGLSEKSIERQQDFLKSITDTIDTGVGAMIDADMEEEAARLQALQVQQQLATQSLSIANQGPQNLLSLFR